jgi:hypothetical protein
MYLLSNTAGLDYCAVIDGPDSAIMPSATHTSQATIVDNATRFLTDRKVAVWVLVKNVHYRRMIQYLARHKWQSWS